MECSQCRDPGKEMGTQQEQQVIPMKAVRFGIDPKETEFPGLK